MTEREKFQIAEMKEFVFTRDSWQCQTCGRSIYHYGTPQMAHRIAATESNIRKYGKEVIHHSRNLKPVCSLRCNDAQNIGFDTEAADSLARSIRETIQRESVPV